MPISPQLEDDLRRDVRRRARLRKRTERQVDKSCARYRSWFESQRLAGEKPPSILAEGDSWFLYMVGKAVIFYIQKKLNIEINNLAYPGDDVAGMLTGKQRQRLVRELKAGPCPGENYDFLLFSGGGNDLVGAETFYKWLLPWQPGTGDLRKSVNWTTLEAMLQILRIGYQDVIDIRDRHSSNTVLVFHGYDFAQPDGRGVCGLGPWLQPGFEERGIPASFRAGIVKIIMQRFEAWLQEFAASNDRVIVVPTQGTLMPGDWANELHPRNAGFERIARKFVFSMFGSGAPAAGRFELTSTGRQRRTTK